MSRILFAVTVFALTAQAAVWSGSAYSSTPPTGPKLEEAPLVPRPTTSTVAPDRLLVRFRPGVSSPDIARVLRQHSASEARFHARSQLHEISVTPADAASTLAALRGDPAVEEAGYSHVARIDYVPNDTNYSYQWSMPDTVGGSRAEPAWDIATHHGQGVVVAVIDTGVAYEDYTGPGPINPSTVYKQAPDLADKTFVSPWDFVNGDAHPNDDNGHGTHVTGTIAEDTNDNYGVAGVAYDATIMPLKVINFDGSGNDADLIDAIYYAVDHGANVISMSLEFQGTGAPDALGNYCAEVVGLPDALDYAYDHGVTVVAAAGNEGAIVTCPAAYPTVIAVGATRFDGQTTSYSNFGPPLDIVAPGGDPNVDQNGDGFSDGVPQETFCYDYFTLLLQQDYEPFCDIFESGTSMATPHVAGAAALLLGEDSSLTPDEVRGYLQSTARDRGPAGWDEHHGWGALDIYTAVASLLGIGPTATPTATATSAVTATKTASSTATTTFTPTPTATNTPVSTPTATATATPTATATITHTPTPSPSNTATATLTPSPTATVDPAHDTDGDGCPDLRELGSDHHTGGQRAPLDYWDFFNVTSDRQVDLSDTIFVLNAFGLMPGADGYDAALDRYVPDLGEPWKSAAALDGSGIDLTDALANLASFGDDCSGP